MSLQNKAKGIAGAGLLVALGFALSYLEHLIPLPFPVGVKLGLANIVTLFAFCTAGKKLALAVLVSRCVLVALVFGSVSSLLFSLSGGLLAYACMAICFRWRGRAFSLLGISMVGAAAHHLGQIGCAALYLQTGAVVYYLPVLLALSVPTGLLTGVVAGMTMKRLARVSAEPVRQDTERIG